ncbi:hypothetical protein COCON_G00209970 [Conger conger]|uniref:Platelet-derived growth factor subunit B n=1 Tax=Conger conger TaxID=82655 RepID=A0A9Q1D027_CONCO|nr:hypothetical protein COCON_G00209970 [Conger conger]
MNSWVLQLVLLAAFLRFGCPEGDPLPAALVELVRNSPITSIQDLQLLLLSDSVEEDPDSRPDRELHSNNTFSRLPRSLEAEPAQQALCKVRTEVLEVTRTMLDRRNADFMLWPPCVEVQRCSGCCNARTLQCVPVITQTRHLQVMKIQYASQRPLYDKAVISVQDHVECRCQTVALAKTVKTTPKKAHPRRQPPNHPLTRARSKEELHRQDELKWNQNFGPDERQARLPQGRGFGPRGGNALPGHARSLESQTGRPPQQVPLGALNLTEQWEEQERALLTGLGLRRPPQDTGEQGPQENGLNGTENATRGRRRGPHRDRAGPSRDVAGALSETRHPQTQAERGAGRAGEQVALEQEREALLALQRELDEENRRIRVLQRQHHQQHQQHHHPHHPTQAHTTTQATVTAPLPSTTRPPPTTQAPPIPPVRTPPRKAPPRKAPPRRRTRKNRRMSKAAMRAMLM